MKFCTQCGAQLDDNQAFCSSCGTPAANPAPVNEEPVADNFVPNDNQPPVNEQVNYQYQPEPDYQADNNYQGYNNYQQATFAQNGFKAPIMNRNIVTCIILSIVTCGIYGLYWYFCIINDLNTASDTPDDASAGMVLLLSIVTCGIYGWIWLYKAGEKVDKIKTMNGEAPSNSSLLYILLAIFGLAIVDYCLIQTELNKVAAN